jgi:hypothetical protein
VSGRTLPPKDEILASRERDLRRAIAKRAEANAVAAERIMAETADIRVRAICSRIAATPMPSPNKDLPLRERVARLEAVVRARRVARRADRLRLAAMIAPRRSAWVEVIR